jgi:predicted metal-binding membrane protein
VARVRPSSATNTWALAALAGASAVAWLALVGYEPPMGLAGFLGGWTLMMAAMMLPSIAPLVLLYRGSRTLLATGYVAVWGAIGVLPYAAMEWGLDPALPVVLALAGVYELTPLKHACLRRCRNAATFLMERYRSGPLRLGVEHAVWCAGCCVGLMAVLVLAASMGIEWAAMIALVIFAQKALPLREWTVRATGVGLVAAAVVVSIL